MTLTTLSKKFQIVVPKEARQRLGLKVGDQLIVWTEKDRLEMTPVRKLKDPIKVLQSLSGKQHKIDIEQLEEELERGTEK